MVPIYKSITKNIWIRAVAQVETVSKGLSIMEIYNVLLER